MKPVLTPEEMAAADKAAISSGIASFDLMQRAGEAVGAAAMRWLRGHYGKRAVIVCGKGNNGGDGMVAAGYLSRRGVATKVFVLDDPSNFSPDAKQALDRSPGLRVQRFDSGRLEREIQRADLVIDAMVGTGGRGSLQGAAAQAAGIIEAAGAAVISVDIPSGVNGRTGRVEGPAVRARKTVTLAALKPGLLLAPGALLAGEVEVTDIGIPGELLDSGLNVAEQGDVARLLPERPPTSHKRSVGKVLVVAGSAGMSGAASLAARGALRAGAGLVWLACPRSIAEGLDQSVAEAIVIALPETGAGTLEASAAGTALEIAAGADAIAVGPGLSRNGETVEFLNKFLGGIDKPIVLDADGINAFEGRPQELRPAGSMVITPHAGELARLMRADTEDFESNRIEAAREAARLTGATVLLKGWPTVVASHRGDTVLVDTGGPVLATGGTGDVLTGIIAAFAAGCSVFDAAWAGAWVHGYAGRILAASIGTRGVVASDLLRVLPSAISAVAGPSSTELD